MRTRVQLLVWILLSFAGAMAQEIESSSALQSMVDAERAFSRMSVEQGTRPAFLTFIAEDGLLFRPTAVHGKKWMQEHPLPASDKRPLLVWQPAFADIAQAGDMGYTFGPWQYKDDIKDEKPVAYGHFATVWKRQADGSWRFAIDHGVSHPQPQAPITPLQISADYKQKPWTPTKVDIESSRKGLIEHDRQFSNSSSAQGPLKAYLAYSSPGVRLFRDGHHPFAGTKGIAEALTVKSSPNAILSWEPAGGDVSKSADLGYTYGTYSVTSKADPQKPVERGNYMRFWKKDKGAWQVVVDVATEIKN